MHAAGSVLHPGTCLNRYAGRSWLYAENGLINGWLVAARDLITPIGFLMPRNGLPQ